MATTKICSKCNKEQEMSEFSFRSGTDRRRGVCKTCTSIYNKVNYINKCEFIKLQVASYKKANKEILREKQLLYLKINKERFKAYRKANANKIREKYKSSRLAKLKSNPELITLKIQRKIVSFSLRFEVLKRDDNKCVMCQNQLTFNTAKCHHILPVSIAPDRVCDLSNLITLCESCHLIAHEGNWRTYDKVWAKQALTYTAKFSSLMADTNSLSIA